MLVKTATHGTLKKINGYSGVEMKDTSGEANVGISVTAVGAMLSSLKAKVEERREWVQMALNANAPQYVSLSRKMGELTKEINDVHNGLNELSTLIGEESTANQSSMECKLRRQVESYENSKVAIAVLTDAVNMLQALCKIRTAFYLFDSAMGDEAYDSAADVIIDMSEQMKILTNNRSSSDLDNLEILLAVDEGCSSRKSHLVNVLINELTTLIDFGLNALTIIKKREAKHNRGGFVCLEHVWYAINRLGILNGCMSQIVRKVDKNIVCPLIESVMFLTNDEGLSALENYNEDSFSIVWTWVNSTTPPIEKRHTEDTDQTVKGASRTAKDIKDVPYEEVADVKPTSRYLVFLSILEPFVCMIDIQMFQSTHDITETFGRQFWPLIAKRITSGLGSPDAIAIDHLKKFETNMTVHQLIPLDQKNVLTKFACVQLESDFTQRKDKMLSTTRQLLISISSVTTTVRVNYESEKKRFMSLTRGYSTKYNGDNHTQSVTNQQMTDGGNLNIDKPKRQLPLIDISTANTTTSILVDKRDKAPSLGLTDCDLRTEFREAALLANRTKIMSQYLSEQTSSAAPAFVATSRSEQESTLLLSKERYHRVLAVLGIDKTGTTDEFCRSQEAAIKRAQSKDDPIDHINNDRVNDDNSHFVYLPSCGVSVAAYRLVSCLYGLTKELLDLVELQGSSNQSGYLERQKFVRDLASLFLVLRAGAHKDKLATDPTYAAIVHTDCLYLAFHLIMLSFANEQFDNSKTKPSSKMVPRSYLDIVLSLNALRRSSFLTIMAKQAEELKVNLGQSLRYMSQDRHYAHVETLLSSAIQHLKLLSTTLSMILPADTFLSALGLLVDLFIQNLLAQVLSLKNVAAEDASSLRDALMSIENQISSLTEMQLSILDEANASSTLLSPPNDRSDNITPLISKGCDISYERLESQITSLKALKLVVKLLGGDISLYKIERSAVKKCFDKDQIRVLLGLTPCLGCSVGEAFKEITHKVTSTSN